MKILLAVTSSISAYKVPSLVRLLKEEGHCIICALTKNAQKIVSIKSLETVSENPVITNMWKEVDPLKHINVNKDTDVLLIAPASANIIGKIANGICDDTITTISCAYKWRKLFAPAMNPEMWQNAAVQKNVKYMTDFLSYEIISPEIGETACKDIGIGRLASFENIINALGSKYKNVRFCITSGSTKEWIDPIRYITNNSSGKMGASIYKEACINGGICTYIEGGVKVHADVCGKSKKISVETTEDLRDAVINSLNNTDILIMAAAPLDFKPKRTFSKKVKKKDINTIDLVTTDDILSLVKEKKRDNSVVVAFAAESAENEDELKRFALEKLERKGADIIVANKIEDAVGKDTDKITIFYKDGTKKEYPKMEKEDCAKIILETSFDIWNKKNNIFSI